jgi:RNA recognition motif-containing protein
MHTLSRSYVTKVPLSVTVKALEAHFSVCGAVRRVSLLTDAVTRQPLGRAYVEFEAAAAAEAAVARLHGVLLPIGTDKGQGGGSVLRVELKRSNPLRQDLFTGRGGGNARGRGRSRGAFGRRGAAFLS